MEAPYRILDIEPAERPRERLATLGAEALAAAELLAVLIGTGIEGRSALQLGRDLLHPRGIAGLQGVSYDELRQRRGLGPSKAARICAAVELGRRLACATPDARPPIVCAADAAQHLVARLSPLVEEQVWVLLLDSRNRLIRAALAGQGGIDRVALSPANVLRPAVQAGASAIVVAHNHPSGDPRPSRDDIAATGRLLEAARTVDIDVIDHLVVGGGRYLSLRELGAGFGA